MHRMLTQQLPHLPVKLQFSGFFRLRNGTRKILGGHFAMSISFSEDFPPHDQLSTVHYFLNKNFYYIFRVLIYFSIFNTVEHKY